LDRSTKHDKIGWLFQGFVPVNIFRQIFKRENLFPLLLVLVVLAVFTPSLIVNVFVHDRNDYDLHLTFTQELLNHQDIPAFTFAHPVWQILVIGVHKLMALSLENSAIIVQLAGYLLLAVILYKMLRGVKTPAWLAAVLALALMIVAPIFLLVFLDKLYYLGYIGITTYHNPTINWLKPFALLIALESVHIFDGRKTTTLRVLGVAMLTLFSTLFKPNLVLCLLPALGVMALYYLWKKQTVDWKMLLGGVAIPAVLVLAWQFFVTYTSGEAGVVFAPLAVMRFYSQFLLLKLILSIWFPLGVSLVYIKSMMKDRSMVFAWLIFVFGAFLTYFMAETGNRFQHGNFGWSGEIANFILFVFATLFFIRMIVSKERISWKEMGLIFVGFIPHLAAGIIYFIHCLTVNQFI
jgi:hypothetical protein